MVRSMETRYFQTHCCATRKFESSSDRSFGLSFDVSVKEILFELNENDVVFADEGSRESHEGVLHFIAICEETQRERIA